MPNICPICEKDDRIMKVSAIVSSGTTIQTSRGTATSIGQDWDVSIIPITVRGISRTQLAKRLRPPAEPQIKRIAGLAFVIFVLIGLRAVVRMIIVGHPYLGALIMVLISTLGILRTRRQAFYPYLKKYKSDRKAWRTAAGYWNQLYYCFRDDVVFNPTTGSHADIGPWHRLLK